MEKNYFVNLTLPLFYKKKMGDRTITYATYINRNGIVTNEEFCDDQDDPEWVMERVRLIAAEQRAWEEKSK